VIKCAWSTSIIELQSSLENIDLQTQKLEKQKIENLITVNTNNQISFSRDLTRIQSVHLVQQNYLNDQYYLEVSNHEIWCASTSKSNSYCQNINTDSYETQVSSSNFYTKLEYSNDFQKLEEADQIVSRMSRRADYLFVALNSSYMFYTKLMYIQMDGSHISM
jgi:hypothetical protein